MRKPGCRLIMDLGIPPRRADVTQRIGHELHAREENGMMTRKRLLLVMLATFVTC